MRIRKAKEKDIPRLLALLGQVLQIHAEIRPDVFISGTTKYTVRELAELLKQEDRPIYVAVNEDDVCMGYAFCQMQKQPFSTNMVPFKSLFIDDLCVDQQARGQHIGESLFEYVKQQAKEQGCYEVTLNVWAGNTSAEHFYEKMGMKTKERQMEYILRAGRAADFCGILRSERSKRMEVKSMLTYTYVSKGTFALMEKPKPVLQHERDAIVKVTLASICSSDLHIKHGSVPRAVPGITVGHEMVGIVEQVGAEVTTVKPGDRVELRYRMLVHRGGAKDGGVAEAFDEFTKAVAGR